MMGIPYSLKKRSLSTFGSGSHKSPMERYPRPKGHYFSTEALTVVMNGGTCEEKCLAI